MSIDKRRCHRLNLDLPASLSLSGGKEDLTLVTVMDVSGLGLRITTKEKIVLGQEISLQVSISPDQSITVKTKVAWVKEMEIMSSTEYAAGLKIIDTMDCDEAQFLKFFSEKFIQIFKKK
ncbi:MAG: PilZ domain-containing protein [Candidatus Aceula meridiana]|nr:PilZ domain-containing protein [Candidatus Aceula meridiana]